MPQRIDIWNQACYRLLELVDEGEYSRWFSAIIPVSFENGHFTLGVANDFFAHWLEDNYQDLVEEAITSAYEEPVSVSFEGGHSLTRRKPKKEIASKRKVLSPVKEKAALPAPVLKAKPVLGCNPKYTFEKFVVGDNSKFGFAACRAVASSPGRVYNPLFIYGNTGLGKTHLMQSIASDVVADNPKAKVEYISSEEFANRFIDAIQHKTLPKFRSHFRSLDLLLIDDVHFFKGKERMQEEFFHTFNALFNAHKQIILTSDRPPHEIDGLERRLVTRFECGQVVDITFPDYETRIAILRQKQVEQKIKLSDDIIDFLASRIKSNVRRLEGALIRLTSYVSMLKEDMDLCTAERLLGSVLEEEICHKVSVQMIQRHVAEYYNLSIADLVGSRRPQNIAFPRQVAMFLSRELTEESLPSIGQSFNKNHATILHAYNNITKKSVSDNGLKASISQLKRQISSQN